MRGFVPLLRRAPWLLAGLVLLGVGCRPAPPEQPLLEVPLLGLDGVPEAAQQQIRQQHARTLAASGSKDAETLGAAYGKLGQLLFTYDLLEAAEPALRNAGALQPQDARWTYYLGILYRQKGAFEEAAARFEQVLAQHPDDTLARLRLAEVYRELGRTDAAKTALEAVVEAEPGNAFAHFLLGQMAYEAEAYADAVAHYETVLRLQPAASQVHAPLGLAYRNLGDEARSRDQLARRGQSLVQLNDPRVRALEAFKQSSGATALTQGQQLIAAGRYQEAVATLERAVAQDSTNPSSYLSLGVARAHLGDRAGAVEAFEHVLRLDPGASKAHFNLGMLLAADGQRAQAEERFRAAVAGDARNSEAHLELAELLRRTGRCAEAVPHFESALEIAPGALAARQHLGLCLLRLGRYAAARALLEDGLAANPGHLGSVDALARVLAASPDADVRDGARALRLAEQALALQRRTETLETLAMAYAELERYEEAVTWQNEAILAARGHDAYLAHLRQNLRRYQQRTPCRTPWPDFMYDR